MKTPILGSSYVALSINAANNRMVNLFPEIVPEGGKEPAFLTRCPGLRLLTNVANGEVRGLWVLGDFSYAIVGGGLYKIDANWESEFIGNIAGQGPVSIADNGTQLFIACNPEGYIYNSFTDVFSQITDTDFPGAVTVGYIDGYFVFNEPDSQRIWTSQLLDGTSIDPLDFASAEGSPDGLVAVNVDHQEIWLFGKTTVEVWYDAGTADFPLQRIQGAVMEIGCSAPYSVAKLDNSLFWLGSDPRGTGVVYRANGYTGVPISTPAISWQIQQYDRYNTINDAIAYTYQQNGHSFYVLTFPSANATWVYDASTQAWHERASFTNGQFMRHRSNCQMFYNRTTVVGDYENGDLYALDPDVYSDNDVVQKWVRSWRALPTGSNNLKRTAQHSLQLDCEGGIGLNLGQGSDPQVMLRWSDDAGHTWSNEHWKSMGRIGQYGYRVIWRRLGMTNKIRDRVYEVSGTDPVKIAIMGAELDVTETNA